MHFKKNGQALSSAGILIGSMLFLGLSSCSAQTRKPEVERGHPKVHTMTIFEGKTECATAEPLIFARPQDVLVFVPIGTAGTVSRLTQPPIDHADGNPLTDGPDSVSISNEHAHAAVISKDAKGEYELKLSCGRFDDDPPRIIVDR